ncbi:MAG TPA: S41 family peptidase [Planctomycetota bacterium]|nr:S41 family peptidase [Planctomycetota bacterium]
MFNRYARRTCLCSVAALALLRVAFAENDAPAIEAKPSFAEPCISPDRSEIAFVSGGDIWTAPAAGGEARLLVSHSATESRPLYSPDGKQLAFVSQRTGNGDIYVLMLASGDVKRITFDDAHEQLDAWSRDGKWLYFSTTGHDIDAMNDIYRVSSEGGTPMPVSDDRYSNEFFAAPSPDGTSIAFNARGFGMRQWWRKGHSHLDESEIWLRKEIRGAGVSPASSSSAPGEYERVTPGGAKELWPMWNANGTALYYVSDRDGQQNIWTKPLHGDARQITHFKDGRVVWPTISYDGAAIVFERNFGVWMLDTTSGQAHEIPLTRRGASAGAANEHISLANHFRDLALSPDGKKLAFVAHGEVFAVSAKDGGDAVRVTHTPAAEENPIWSGDSKRLIYVSTRGGVSHLFQYDFTNNTETQLTNDAQSDAQPMFSPDGKMLAFQRGGCELCVMDVGTKQVHSAANACFDRPPLNSKRPYVWSHDSYWLAYSAPSAGKAFRNVSVVPAAGGPSKQVSFLSNVYSNTISWSPDGTFMLVQSGQRTERSGLARIDLVPRALKFREDQFRDLFKDDAPAKPRIPWPLGPSEQKTVNSPAPPKTPSTSDKPDAAKETASTSPKEPVKPVEPKKSDAKHFEIAFDSIRQRQTLLPLGLDIYSEVISPDGKWAVLTAGTWLYTYSLDDMAREQGTRPLVSTGGNKSDAQFSPDNKEVYYLDNGHIDIASMEQRTTRTLNVNAEMDVDFDHEKNAVFNQAWSYLRDHFFDEKFNGADWNAVKTEYAPRVAGARTPDEMRRIISMMLGELNASHMGISGDRGAAGDQAGRLGLRFDRAEYETNGVLKITEVIPYGPAAIAGIKEGERIASIDGQSITARTNLDEVLAHKIGRRTVLNVKSAGGPPAPQGRDVAVRPIAASAEKTLMYKQWVEQRRAYVDKISHGRLGYVHMADMLENSLNQLYVDLDAENHTREGVVIDIRNNDGGFVDPYAIDVLARRPYLTMTPRGQGIASGRTLLGQRALEAPTILVTNQHSLSDAESFTEGYRSLKLGKVVGEPTAGWIIFTSNEPLLDGSSLRIPHTRVLTTSGEAMEMKPRRVDLEVTRPIGECYSGHDCQLDVAVEELLKEIGGK